MCEISGFKKEMTWQQKRCRHNTLWSLDVFYLLAGLIISLSCGKREQVLAIKGLKMKLRLNDERQWLTTYDI